MKRHHKTRLCVALLLMRGATALSADDGAGELERLRRLNQSHAVDRVVDHGLDFLRSQQNPDGSFGQSLSKRTAMTSLAILAFLARGRLAGDSPGGKAVLRGTEYILADGRQTKDGYFGADESRMYGHAITVLMLAEVMGMGTSDAQDRKIFVACQRGVDLILEAQSVAKPPGHGGGWRYTPASSDSDVSVTAWVVMALRAAQNAGMKIQRRAIDRAVAYIKKRFLRGEGGFTYTPGRDATVSISAAGLLSLQVCGIYSGRHVTAGARWLRERLPQWQRRGWYDSWFYYGIYYYSQAMHQCGGEDAAVASAAVKALLIEKSSPAKQLPDGSWPPPPRSGQEREAGPVYRTAMAILALSVEYRLLPIYQR